jgi:predicted DNA-binding transcriptional regulator AlpA
MTRKQKQQSLRFYSWADLRAHGVSFHTNHLRRLWMDGKFPRPVKLSPGKLAWNADEVDAWLAEKMKGAKEAS